MPSLPLLHGDERTQQRNHNACGQDHEISGFTWEHTPEEDVQTAGRKLALLRRVA